MTDERETRLKRLRIRAWRRGTKEMDLILGPFADGPLVDLDGPALDAFEALMDEGDNDLYTWIAGTADAPEAHLPSIMLLRRFHGIAGTP